MTIYLKHIHLIYFQLPAATRRQNIDWAPGARSATSLKAPPENTGGFSGAFAVSLREGYVYIYIYILKL